MPKPLLVTEALCKVYPGPVPLTIVQSLDWTIHAGERLAIMGRSGSGKTTLLNLLAGLDTPTSGAVYVEGCDLHRMRASQRELLRNQRFGFVFQFHHLLPEFTALENVAMPLWIGGMSARKAQQSAVEFLKKVELFDQRFQKPATLSGGERQRVAIARALVTRPACVFADEPTGNLDSATASAVYTVMDQLTQSAGTAFVVVTHDLQLAQRLGQIRRLVEGALLLESCG